MEQADATRQIKRCLEGVEGLFETGKGGDMLPCTGTMQSSKLLSGTLLCALLLLSSAAGAEVLDIESEEELSPRALRDFYPKGPNLTSEKQLVRAALGVGMQKHDAAFISQRFLLLSGPFRFLSLCQILSITFSYSVKISFQSIFVYSQSSRCALRTKIWC